MGSDGAPNKGKEDSCKDRKAPSTRLTDDERDALAERVLALRDKAEEGSTWLDMVQHKVEEYGVQLPDVVVKYRDLTVTTQALVGQAGVPTVISPLVNMAKTLLRVNQSREEQPLKLLDNVSGVLKPGRLTLLLGPPSSGKSTFLKVLSGRMRKSSYTKVEGDIWFNGKGPHEFEQSLTAAYVAQLDNHEANLTVRETLDFAYLCTVGTKGDKFNMAHEIYRKKVEAQAARKVDPELGMAGPSEASLLADKASAGNGSAGGSHGHDEPSTPSHQGASVAHHANGNGTSTTNGDRNSNGSADSHAANGNTSNGNGHGMAAAMSFKRLQKLLSRRGSRRDCPEVEMDELEQLLEQVESSVVKVDVVMKLLGLSHCSDTQVGNEIFRGISGGERKRLTTAEQVLGNQVVLMMDEISTGLDSATLFTIIRWFSKWAHATRKTAVISLLQPPPEVFLLFDDVLIFTSGQVLYHGPVQDAVGFFEDLGFMCPARKDIPSFLLEVGTPKGQTAYASQELRVRHGLPQRGGVGKVTWMSQRNLMVPLHEISEAFWTRNKHGKLMAQELEDAPAAAAAGPAVAAAKQAAPAKADALPSTSSTTSSSTSGSSGSHPAALVLDGAYPLKPWESVLVATRRQMTLVLRDRVLLRGRMMQVIVLGLICGSLFYQLPVSLTGARTYFGLAFLVTLFTTFGGFPQMPLTVEAKKVWYKHRANRFLPPYAYGMAMALAQFPLSIIESIIFSNIMYWMVGLYPNAGNFFCFFLTTFLNSLVASAIFRFLGCVSPTAVVASSAGGLVLVTLIISSGFAIIRFDIPAWMIWAYWVSPFAWGLRAFAINEMATPRWQELPYPDNPSQSLGNGALESFGFYTDRSWIYYNILFQAGAYVLLTAGACVSLWLSQPPEPRAALPDEEELAKARADAEGRRQQIAAMREANKSMMREQRPPSPGPSPGKLQTIASLAAANADIDIASSLEFTPITLVFKDIGYTVPNPIYSRKAARQAAKAAAANPSAPKAAQRNALPGQHNHIEPKLQLLDGVTGYSEPGVLMALMGGSGAGKTTLMDVLAGRKTVGEITGDILVNGHPKDQRTWSRVVGYCEQTDVHTPLTTVREALMFSARLRLPPSIPDSKMLAYVDEVLDMVDLIDIQFDVVGTAGQTGLSVEQRKRLTIGVELVANPSVVFMDEPTSGLDARAAAIVMQAVRNVARNGRTVMVTIHQPSIEIFEAFDMLLLIQRGGLTTYFGPLGEHSQRLIDYLMAVPGTPALPLGFNPSTWMLEVTGGSMATMVKPVEVDWPVVYARSELAHAARQHADELIQAAQAEGLPALSITTTYAMPFTVQFKWLMVKFLRIYWRNPGYNLMRFFTTFSTAWIYALVYWDQGQLPVPATIASVQAIMGVMYSGTNFMGMTNLMSVMPLVGYERVVFYRERGASMYNPFAYGLAIALVEVPYLLAQAAVFMPIMYWTINFEHSADKFFYYTLMFISNIAFYNIFGQFLVYMTPSQGIAQVAGGGLNFLMNLFNGFIITYPDIPKGWRWLNRAVPTTWMMYGLAVSQLDRPDIPIMYNGHVTNVQQFMQQRFGYEPGMRWWCLLIVFAYIVFVRVASVCFLAYWNFLRR